LGELAAEALGRLGIETVPSRMEQAYNAGKTVQVPTGRVIGVRGRVRRKISYNGCALIFERAKRSSRAQAARDRDAPLIDTTAPPITVRDALRLFWEVDRYPILGNEDLQVACLLEEEARAKAAHAVPAPDDPPEFALLLATLCGRTDTRAHDDAISALYDLFDPEREPGGAGEPG
jgi:hypothetical protein